MALLPQDRQSQVMLLITILMAGLGWAFWTYWEQPTSQQIGVTRVEIDSLQRVIERAKQDLQSGTVEDLRRKVEQYTALLSVMRRLVPEKNEVPALIDDISTKAKVRGVTIGRLEPLAVEAGPRPAPRALADSARGDSTKADSAGSAVLVREVYSYEGGGRDPFLSLLRSGDIRPLLSDLKLVGVYYDGRLTARSVAVLRDVTNRKIYRVKPGDIIGRLKVTSIRPREIVFTVQEFGFERQESLQLAKQEVTP